MRLVTLAAGFVLALTSIVAAQPYETPDALIEAFYQSYFNDSFPEDESQFRSAALQALYDNDAQITPEGEMGAISFDPYIDGQDYDITEFEMGAAGIAGDYASIDVTFNNFGEPRSLTYELVREDGGWKIDDVVSTNPDNPYRLSQIFADAAAMYQ
jgi:hypothetical protein